MLLTPPEAADLSSLGETDAKAPGSRSPWRIPRLWRGALAGGLTVGALAMLRWAEPSLDDRLLRPCLLLLGAFVIAGPPQRNRLTAVGAMFTVAAVLLFAWPCVYAFTAAPEAEAAVLSMMSWIVLPCLLLLGWRLRQLDADLPALTIAFAAGLNLLLSLEQFAVLRSPFLTWWLLGALWVALAALSHRSLARSVRESLPLLAASAWFAFVIFGLTFVEFRSPFLALLPEDTNAAEAAIAARPWLGWGLGGMERVMLEFSRRDPALAPFQPTGLLRLTGELGSAFLALAGLLGVGALVLLQRGLGWSRSRGTALGLWGFWVVAALTVRVHPFEALAVLALLSPAWLAREPGAPGATPRGWVPWGLGCAGLLAAAFLPTIAKSAYAAEEPWRNLEARSPVPHWTTPLREKAWLIKALSPELVISTDPRDLMEPVVREWLQASPHDILPHAEAIRLASMRGDGDAAIAVATAAHQRLPWDDVPVLWMIRLLLQEDRPEEAQAVLEGVFIRRGRLSPLLQQRVLELRAAASESPSTETLHGERD